MTNNTERARKSGAMELKHTKETSLKARKMDRADSCGVMVLIMREILLMECFKVMVLISLKTLTRLIMEASIMERLKVLEK